MTLLEAMAREEGFYVKGTRPNRNNNPGDIEFGPFAQAHGSIKSDGRFAIFPTSEAGFEAMKALLLKHYSGLTLEAALNKYAPPVENDTNTYLNRVCEWTGLKPGTLIEEALHLIS